MIACDDTPWVVVEIFYGTERKPVWKKLIGFFYKTEEEAQKYLRSIHKSCNFDERIERGYSTIKIMKFEEYVAIQTTT